MSDLCVKAVDVYKIKNDLASLICLEQELMGLVNNLEQIQAQNQRDIDLLQDNITVE